MCPGVEEMCIRCRECSVAGGQPYCAHCGFAVRTEAREGLDRLEEYLTRWAEFDAWCERRNKQSLRLLP
jgi:hypothetical protein